MAVRLCAVCMAMIMGNRVAVDMSVAMVMGIEFLFVHCHNLLSLNRAILPELCFLYKPPGGIRSITDGNGIGDIKAVRCNMAIVSQYLHTVLLDGSQCVGKCGLSDAICFKSLHGIHLDNEDYISRDPFPDALPQAV